MVEHCLVGSWLRGFPVVAFLGFWGSLAFGASPAPPAVPRAQLIQVDLRFLQSGSAVWPGAGVRAFQDPAREEGGSERIDIHWYANPPGLPPGTVLLFECVQHRSPSVRNRALRISEKAEGHIRSVIEIPSDVIQQDGRIREWRVSLVWRGRILDRQTSRHWEG
jgi:hypothetical protein